MANKPGILYAARDGETAINVRIDVTDRDVTQMLDGANAFQHTNYHVIKQAHVNDIDAMLILSRYLFTKFNTSPDLTKPIYEMSDEEVTTIFDLLNKSLVNELPVVDSDKTVTEDDKVESGDAEEAKVDVKSEMVAEPKYKILKMARKPDAIKVATKLFKQAPDKFYHERDIDFPKAFNRIKLSSHSKLSGSTVMTHRLANDLYIYVHYDRPKQAQLINQLNHWILDDVALVPDPPEPGISITDFKTEVSNLYLAYSQLFNAYRNKDLNISGLSLLDAKSINLNDKHNYQLGNDCYLRITLSYRINLENALKALKLFIDQNKDKIINEPLNHLGEKPKVVLSTSEPGISMAEFQLGVQSLYNEHAAVFKKWRDKNTGDAMIKIDSKPFKKHYTEHELFKVGDDCYVRYTQTAHIKLQYALDHFKRFIKAEAEKMPVERSIADLEGDLRGYYELNPTAFRDMIDVPFPPKFDKIKLHALSQGSNRLWLGANCYISINYAKPDLQILVDQVENWIGNEIDMKAEIAKINFKALDEDVADDISLSEFKSRVRHLYKMYSGFFVDMTGTDKRFDGDYRLIELHSSEQGGLQTLELSPQCYIYIYPDQMHNARLLRQLQSWLKEAVKQDSVKL